MAGKRLSFFVHLSVLIFAATSVHAAEQSTATDRLGAGAMTSQVVMALGAVLICIVGLAWVAKRLSGSSLMRQGGMKLLSSLPVGTKERLVLVEVEGEKLLLGVTTGGISRLHNFSGKTSVQENTSSTGESAEPTPIKIDDQEVKETAIKGKKDFSGYLKKLLVDGSNS